MQKIEIKTLDSYKGFTPSKTTVPANEGFVVAENPYLGSIEGKVHDSLFELMVRFMISPMIA